MWAANEQGDEARRRRANKYTLATIPWASSRLVKKLQARFVEAGPGVERHKNSRYVHLKLEAKTR